jgi:hypothetical protein
LSTTTWREPPFRRLPRRWKMKNALTLARQWELAHMVCTESGRGVSLETVDDGSDRPRLVLRMWRWQFQELMDSYRTDPMAWELREVEHRIMSVGDGMSGGSVTLEFLIGPLYMRVYFCGRLIKVCSSTGNPDPGIGRPWTDEDCLAAWGLLPERESGKKEATG